MAKIRDLLRNFARDPSGRDYFSFQTGNRISLFRRVSKIRLGASKGSGAPHSGARGEAARLQVSLRRLVTRSSPFGIGTR